MLVKVKRGWELPEHMATPEHVFWNRREIAKTIAAGPIVAAAASTWWAGRALAADESDPSAGLYPVQRNPKFVLDRKITAEKDATTYNNFYEFGSQKQIWREAQRLTIRPWEISIEGMVEKPFKIGIDDLLKKVTLEERLYRHRCVEAWAMAVPWSGFPLRKLVELAKPTAGARYVEMHTIGDNKSEMPGLRQFWYPWPYTEGLTIEEATNDLAFMVTGLYGKPVPRQNGAPLRLAVPWKYGFKSIKSIVSFTFTDKRPVSFWQALQANEYGFWANVNPKVPHPRWSQATEWLLGGSQSDRIPTQLFNGYAEYVADLYKGIKGEQLYR